MPRRAASGDRRAIEAALSPSLRAALEDLREILNVDDWQLSPLGPVFQATAVTMVADRLEQEGASPTPALELASFALGMPPTTSRDRASRWPRESRRGAPRIIRVDAPKQAG